MIGKTKIIIAALITLLLLTTFAFFGCKEEPVEEIQNISMEIIDGEGNSVILDQPAKKINNSTCPQCTGNSRWSGCDGKGCRGRQLQRDDGRASCSRF